MHPDDPPPDDFARDDRQPPDSDRDAPRPEEGGPFNVVPVPITVSRPAHQRVMQLWQWFYVTGHRAVETETPPGGVMLTVFNQLALLATEDPDIVRQYVDTVAEMSPAAIGGAAVGAAELRDTLRHALDASDDPAADGADTHDSDPDESAAA